MELFFFFGYYYYLCARMLPTIREFSFFNFYFFYVWAHAVVALLVVGFSIWIDLDSHKLYNVFFVAFN